VGAFFGFREFASIQKLREGAERLLAAALADADQAQKAVSAATVELVKAQERFATAAGELESQGKRLSDMARAAFDQIDTFFEQLKSIEGVWVVGTPAPLIPADISLAYEEADVVLVVCDRLGWITHEPRASRYFSKLGRYWRTVGNYPRALARMQRAVSLDQNAAWPHLELGRTLAYQASESTLDTEQKRAVLDQAERTVRRAQELGKDANTLESLAWILDEKGEFADAVTAYREARDLNRRGVAEQGGDEDWGLTYNLACALAKWGKAEQAGVELATILNKGDYGRLANEDPDLAAVLHPPGKP
jgi:tetratricopeptide (TPR) repeat protein